MGRESAALLSKEQASSDHKSARPPSGQFRPADVNPLSRPLGPEMMKHLQRTAGNAAVASLVSGLFKGPTLSTGIASDAKSAGGEEEPGEDVVSDRRDVSQTVTVQRDNGSATTTGTQTKPWTRAQPTPATATVPGTVRAANSPAGMNDRIPPGTDFDAALTVTGPGLKQSPVTVEVTGSGGAAGTVDVNGGPSTTIDTAGSSTVKLRPSAQTAAGSGGQLKLTAKQGTNILAQSAGFSVSAIPQDYTDTFKELLKGKTRGFKVQDGWSSDSPGGIADLDQAEISEHVEVTSTSGCFVGLGASNSGYLPANKLTTDTHSSPASAMTSAGTRVASQTCSFNDKRSGSTDIPMRNSGYLLTRTVTKKPAGMLKGLVNKALGWEYQFTLTKAGTAVTANGVASGAGTGNITKTQDVSSGDEI